MENSSENRYLAGFVTGVITALVTFLIVLLIYMMLSGNGLSILNKDSVGDYAINANEEVEDSIDEIADKIEYLAGIIYTYYLEDVDTDEIVEGIYKGIFESINDPYTAYYTAEEYKELLNATNGQFVGIGVRISENEDGNLIIKEFMDGGDAQSEGMQIGDVIIKVDGEDIASKEYADVVNSIQGEEGTKVKLTVLRTTQDGEKELEFEVTRHLIDTISVYSKMEDNNIGYIYITGFEANTANQFKEQLQELMAQGMEGLIIDLRENGGGLLTSVTAIADCLMDEGVLVTMKDKSGEVKNEVNTTDDTILDVPLVVLVNGNSASASEVLAGAVKDRDIGELVGMTTYGKGIVQSIIPLNDGSAIKITTERYYTPSGNYIHGVGIEPDYVVEYDDDKASEGIDVQYDKAVEVLEKMMEKDAVS